MSTTTHDFDIEEIPASSTDTGAFAFFCQCGERGDWIHADDMTADAAQDEAFLQGQDHQESADHDPFEVDRTEDYDLI